MIALLSGLKSGIIKIQVIPRHPLIDVLLTSFQTLEKTEYLPSPHYSSNQNLSVDHTSLQSKKVSAQPQYHEGKWTLYKFTRLFQLTM